MQLDDAFSSWIRIGRSDSEIQIRVQEVSWPQVHTPTTRWLVAATLPIDANEEAVASAVKQLLGDPQYFGLCVECNERFLRCHMWEDEICQGCAAGNHGVVF